MPDHDNVLLITGASSGIGAAVARMAAERGYRLALLARSADKLQTLRDEPGRDAIACTCDVSSADDLKPALRWTGSARRTCRAKVAER